MNHIGASDSTSKLFSSKMFVAGRWHASRWRKLDAAAEHVRAGWLAGNKTARAPPNTAATVRLRQAVPAASCPGASVGAGTGRLSTLLLLYAKRKERSLTPQTRSCAVLRPLVAHASDGAINGGDAAAGSATGLHRRLRVRAPFLISTDAAAAAARGGFFASLRCPPRGTAVALKSGQAGGRAARGQSPAALASPTRPAAACLPACVSGGPPAPTSDVPSSLADSVSSIWEARGQAAAAARLPRDAAGAGQGPGGALRSVGHGTGIAEPSSSGGGGGAHLRYRPRTELSQGDSVVQTAYSNKHALLSRLRGAARPPSAHATPRTAHARKTRRVRCLVRGQTGGRGAHRRLATAVQLQLQLAARESERYGPPCNGRELRAVIRRGSRNGPPPGPDAQLAPESARVPSRPRPAWTLSRLSGPGGRRRSQLLTHGKTLAARAGGRPRAGRAAPGRLRRGR
ncbi:uncharacterized protein LOC126485074 [Schistocerca serialis cubense]|uniref:uncharacterized protein LOC126485074 n=1 Tax=Schistocerca serialis cubense TaxID=2023355 RepID=UPI00214F03C3|nr:uncharacterized protein LOC126485074 [Schistocerca serialis cubense]